MILVVDDDPEIRRLLLSYLKRADFEVRTASDATQARRIIAQTEPELLLLDLGLPDQDGFSFMGDLRKDGIVPFPVIVVTARVGDSDKVMGLDLGADDYVTKPFVPREVVARVKAVLRRTSRRDGGEGVEEISLGEFVYRKRTQRFFWRQEEIRVTPTERAIVVHLMSHPEWVFSREDLLVAALGYDYEGMGRTLDTHIRNLRKKIHAATGKESPIETVFGVGYRWRSCE